ncbi:hypothetical protein OIU84_027652 [Salix udensis]|uniref:Uncharacterized protein n=1 Tax=Salix udensis TaxID=889485 RepID=A0AAD6KHQ6_9ROSI|nr:hypothetical protein OIU84_027652 [Salix udensis]
MDVNGEGEEEGTRAGGIGVLRWSTVVKGRKRGEGRLSTTGGRGRLGELVAVGSGGLRWSTVVKGNKKKRKGRGRGGTKAGGTGDCRKWWSMMVDIMKGRRRGKGRPLVAGGRGRVELTGEGIGAGELVAVGSDGLRWSTVVKGNKKKRKKVVSGGRKRYVGADKRGMLMARERKRELVAVGTGGLRWSAVVKGNKKKRRKVVSG